MKRTHLLIAMFLLALTGAGIFAARWTQPSAQVANTPEPSAPAAIIPVGRTSLWDVPDSSEHAAAIERLPIASVARFQRPEDEWQGMLPASYDIWPCMPDGHCDKARACIAGHCLPCTADTECQQGELCVLGHCLRDTLVECSSRSDCEHGGLCVLSGYSSLNLRGNADMRAYCPGSEDTRPLTAKERLADVTIQQTSMVVPSPSGPSPQDRALALLRAKSQGQEPAAAHGSD